jgi:S-layer homology domain/Trypsin
MCASSNFVGQSTTNNKQIDQSFYFKGHPPMKILNFSLLLMLGCSQVATISEPTESSVVDPSNLLGGTTTSSRPEVGFLAGGTTSACTATLVTESTLPNRASRFVLTASHCVGFRSQEEPNLNANLTFTVAGKAYKVVRQHAWLRTPNVSNRDLSSRLRDIALLELEREVPLSDATPALIGRIRPERNEQISVFGFGCTNRCDQTQGTEPRVKRLGSVLYGSVSFQLCPGDSGGPYIDARNQVVRINSAFHNQRQNDIAADVVGLGVEIEAKMALFRSQPYLAKAKTPIGELNTCGACTSSGASGGIGSPSGNSWCINKKLCLSFGGLADISCKGDRVVRFEEDCVLADPNISDDIVGTHCTAAADCKSCQERYNCIWTTTGCFDSPNGVPPKGTQSTLPRTNPLCCPGTTACNNNGVCDRQRGETVDNCSSDCRTRPSCNQNGICEANAGETAEDCGTDCRPSTCNNNSVCDVAQGEWCGTCGDCFCTSAPQCNNNGTCEPRLGETVRTCAKDCPVGAPNPNPNPNPNPAPKFSDVITHPARAEIESLANLGLISGDPAGTFRPNAAMSRAEVAALVSKVFLQATVPAPIMFSDVAANAWYADAVARCVAAGAMSGFPDKTFHPNESVSRQQALAILAGVKQLSGGAFLEVQNRFADANSVASWAQSSAANAQHNGLLANQALLEMGGLPLVLRPLANATRAEVASLVFFAQQL